MNVKVNEEYKKLLPPLTREEYESLKESIRKNVILDGHNRYEICNELGIEPKFDVKHFDNPLLEKRFVIEANLRRRHLNKFQRIEMAKPLLEIERQLARQRQIQLGKTHGEDPLVPIGTKGKAVENVARSVGVSTRTFYRAIVIMESGSEELKESVRGGRTSIAYAYTKIRRGEKHEDPPPLPEEEFNVIYADPPWQYELPLRGDPELHYPTMSTQELCDLKIPVASDAVLFLWATNPKLEEAFKVIKAWGFEYKTNMVWVKDKAGTGYYFRGQHELLLVAKRGEMPAPTEETRPPSVLEVPRKGHSVKPEVVYEIIERMYPNRKYLELFARNKRENWTCWGNETKKETQRLSRQPSTCAGMGRKVAAKT